MGRTDSITISIDRIDDAMERYFGGRTDVGATRETLFRLANMSADGAADVSRAVTDLRSLIAAAESFRDRLGPEFPAGAVLTALYGGLALISATARSWLGEVEKYLDLVVADERMRCLDLCYQAPTTSLGDDYLARVFPAARNACSAEAVERMRYQLATAAVRSGDMDAALGHARASSNAPDIADMLMYETPPCSSRWRSALDILLEYDGDVTEPAVFAAADAASAGCFGLATDILGRFGPDPASTSKSTAPIVALVHHLLGHRDEAIAYARVALRELELRSEPDPAPSRRGWLFEPISMWLLARYEDTPDTRLSWLQHCDPDRRFLLGELSSRIHLDTADAVLAGGAPQ